MKLKDFIVRTTFSNTDTNGSINPEFSLSDYVFIDSPQELTSKESFDATQFAKINGQDATDTLLRHCYKSNKFSKPNHTVLKNNNISILSQGENTISHNKNYGISPRINLDAKAICRAIQEKSLDFIVTKETINGVTHHYVEFGEYPNYFIAPYSDKFNTVDISKYKPTGKKFYQMASTNLLEHFEFENNGQKVIISQPLYDVPCDRFMDSGYTVTIKKGCKLYFSVDPIKWEILNWDELPKDINFEGSEKARFISLRTATNIISGVPFVDKSNKYPYLYQNSILRAFLNGYDLKKEIVFNNNGKVFDDETDYADFTNKGFLDTAFEEPIYTNIKFNPNTKSHFAYAQKIKKSRLEKLNPDMTPNNLIKNMTDTEIIKSWIDSGESVLLRGPSGIGKTERIKKLYPDLIYIKLTNNMFPEKVVGSMNLQTGDAIPPDFVKHALLSEASEDEKKLVSENIQNLFSVANEIYERSKNSDKKVVIMLDELLNVKPAVQSLVYTLVLNKFVEIGKGLKLPANTVIVATGNQKKYSIVAEDLAEPLEKRFDHILDMEPKVGEWLSEYAIPNNLHPAVVGYIFSKYLQNKKSESICDIGYFYEEPEVGETNLDKFGCKGKTNDPRGWASLSNSICNFENNLKTGKYVGRNVENILKTTLYSKLRNEWAEDFFDFYNKPVLSPQDIVNNQYTETDFPTNINERFAQLAGLLTANESQVKECRKFIQEHCDPEYLSVYDIYWAGNDENKIQKIAELQEMDAISISEDNIATTY